MLSTHTVTTLNIVAGPISIPRRQVLLVHGRAQPAAPAAASDRHRPGALPDAASTLETMLSLSVNIDVDSAGASLSPGSTLSTHSRHTLDTLDTLDTSVNRHHPDTASTLSTLSTLMLDRLDALTVSTAQHVSTVRKTGTGPRRPSASKRKLTLISTLLARNGRGGARIVRFGP